jgi:hypothetical protein
VTEPADIDGGRLWLAGLLTALVAAAAGAIAFLIAEGLLDLDLLHRGRVASNDPASLEFAHVVVVAVWVTVCATGLLHLLLLTTERAVAIFAWTSVAILALSWIPIIALDADADVKIMLGVLHVVVAVPIIVILMRVATSIVAPARDADTTGTKPTTPAWALVTLTALTIVVGGVGVLVINARGDRPDSEAEELISDMNEGVSTANEGLATTNDLLGQLLAGIG